MKYLEIAKFVKTHGLKGELKAASYAGSPADFTELKRFFIGPEKTPAEITRCAVYKGGVILKIKNVDDIDAAVKLLRKTLYADADEKKLDEGEFYIADLLGLTVKDADSGKIYGAVEEILQNAPTDVYSVRTPEGKQLLFPAIPEVLVNINTEAGEIVIRPLEGLFEE
jgi:16S rRNA processing protein RimM